MSGHDSAYTAAQSSLPSDAEICLQPPPPSCRLNAHQSSPSSFGIQSAAFSLQNDGSQLWVHIKTTQRAFKNPRAEPLSWLIRWESVDGA